MRNPVYTRAEDTALRLVTAFGQSGQVRRLTMAETSPDLPWRVAPTAPIEVGPIKFVRFENDGRYFKQEDGLHQVAETTTTRAFYVLLIVPNVGMTVKPNDLVVGVGAKYNVVATKALNPDGQGIIVMSALAELLESE